MTARTIGKGSWFARDAGTVNVHVGAVVDGYLDGIVIRGIHECWDGRLREPWDREVVSR